MLQDMPSNALQVCYLQPPVCAVHHACQDVDSLQSTQDLVQDTDMPIVCHLVAEGLWVRVMAPTPLVGTFPWYISSCFSDLALHCDSHISCAAAFDCSCPGNRGQLDAAEKQLVRCLADCFCCAL